MADLTAVAKKYIHPEKLAILVVGNEPEIKPGLDALDRGPAHPVDITIPIAQGAGGSEDGTLAEGGNGEEPVNQEKESAAAAARLMAAGVRIHRADTCVFDAGVEVAAGTEIEPFVQLLGKTRIGAECRIRSFTVIEDCTLGDRVLVRQSCVLEESRVEAGAKIGPFAHLRPGSEIGEDAHVGNFVETKKAKLGKGAKASHLTYLGDAEVGEGTNIGAGVITCNYDGVHKHHTHIGKGAFVGSDSTLVAPVRVEDGAFIGAGSCITENVPAGALALGRARQITMEGWVEARRAHPKTKH